MSSGRSESARRAARLVGERTFALIPLRKAFPKGRVGNGSKKSRQARAATRQAAFFKVLSLTGMLAGATVGIALADGEYDRQYCLDQGNAPATVARKLKEIKAVFQLAVRRRQLEDNPLAYITKPRCPKTEIRTYSDDECRRMVKAAREFIQGADPAATVR